MSVKILQTNVGRAYVAHDMAYATAKEQDIDILIICEPNKSRVKEETWIKDNRVSVAMLIMSRGLDVKGHKVGDGHIMLMLSNCTIVCCYLSPNIPMHEYKKEVDSIMKHVNKHEFIILGDINAKSFLWGSPRTDEKGEYWVEWISAKDMIVQNTGLKPTFVRGETKSYIDVTMSTSKIAKKITSWEVLDVETLTEHKYIYFEIGGIKVKKKEKIKSIVDWEVFKTTIELIGKDINEADYKTCTKLMQQAYKNSMERQTTHAGAPYWWNNIIAEKRQKCIRARRKLYRSSRGKGRNKNDLEELREIYRECRRTLNKCINESKLKHWKDLCQELDNDIWGDAYRIVAKKLNNLTPYELCEDRKRQIASDLFPPMREQIKTEAVELNVKPFTEEELNKAVLCMKNGKAPGLDKIPPEAVKLVAKCQTELLLGAMNQQLKIQEFPEDWKVARVILIIKAGKARELSSSFRPLCMLNTLSKLLEALVRNRLDQELEAKGGLHIHQYGFRKGKSTLQAVETVIDTSKEFNRKWCALITIDVKNAFNSASHEIIIQELKDRKISRYLVNIITSYLNNRKIMVNEGEKLETGAGVPQGSVLGPTLWNVLYDGVLDLQLTGDAMTVAFADDLALIVGAGDEETLVENTNKCLEAINKWMTSHNLILAPDKTEAVLLRGKKKRDEIYFELGGVRITPTKDVRYLGIIIDERGSFGKHIETVTAKAQEKISKLSRLMPNLGGPCSGRRQVLCCAMHNILLYGAPIWKKALNIKKYNEKMIMTQRNMLLRVASAFRTVSATALQVITGTVPIDLMATERTLEYEHRKNEQQILNKTAARETTIIMWQKRWDDEMDKAQWTKRLVRDIKPWIDCKHRKLDYCLTQALTAHGVFRFYAKRMGKDTSDECIYCAKTDTAEHTLFECWKWDQIRQQTYGIVGNILTPETIVPKMLENKENWRSIHHMIQQIMRQKEKEELERQKQARQRETIA